MTSALLVFSPQDAGTQECIRDAFDEQGVEVDTEKSIEGILKRLSNRPGQYSYLVCGLLLAADKYSPIMPQGGVSACSEIRSKSKAPIALIVPGRIDEFRVMVRTLLPAPFVYLYETPELAAKVVKDLQKMTPPPPRLDVLIQARRRDHHEEWTYDLLGSDVGYRKHGNLNPHPAALAAQRAVSLGLAGNLSPRWFRQFADLGESIAQDLLLGTPQFHEDLKAGINVVGGICNTRLSFSVAPDHYDIALEAIRRPDNVPEPWMIHAPLVRRIAHDKPPSDSTLFDGNANQKLKCLVICADTSGFVDKVTNAEGQPIFLEEMAAIRSEFVAVAEALAAQGHNVVTVGEKGDEEPLTIDRLLNVIRAGNPWDIVHFAGHSMFDADRKTGYLFVGKKDDPEPVEIGKVMPYLRDSKLLYLSSCESGNSTFAIEAASAGVPAVIGFRWRIVDVEAERHARLFYRRLFEKRAIDTAFWSVRKEIHDENRQNSAWASSMLVMNA